MAQELAYALITPHSLKKSRTGGIVARLISRSGLEVVGARMFAPGEELVDAYSGMMVTEQDPGHRATQEQLASYVQKHLRPSPEGTRQRVMMLLLHGEDAVRRVLEVAGHIVHGRTSGETIRDTYGDYILEGDRVVYFEPAVMVAPDSASCKKHLALWSKYSESDGGIVPSRWPEDQEGLERTLVLIKPDNFRFPNARMGNVIDVFSQTGLAIAGVKVHHMSVAEAEEFYGPVLPVLEEAFKAPNGKRARLAVEKELGIALNEETESQLGERLGPVCGRNHWENIVQFMCGTRPSDCPEEERQSPGSEKCVALVYEGPDAVRRIRSVLGPTDPSKAPTGSIRREFGQTMMINAAHASDSVENAQREMKIIRMCENHFKSLIDLYFAST